VKSSFGKSVLLILDGWGIASNPEVSAVDIAETPFMDSLQKSAITTKLEASGSHVGLPQGQMGNSEVGHMNLGAGRIVYQDLPKIDLAFKEKAILQNENFQSLLKNSEGKKLHLLGLVSDGGVHSHINHLKGLLTILADNGLVDVYLHAFTDGRDTDPNSGKGYLKDIECHMKNTTGKVASICGRYFSMDRDNRWERTQKAYNLIVRGEGRQFNGHASDAIQSAYDLGQTDEFISPIQIEPVEISDNDIVLFFNFRTDRGRQLTKVLTQQDFSEIDMFKLKTQFYTLTNYDQSFSNIKSFLKKII
jgi:2,3-bisphosphoglycerate-independent phosphoglycerate mutase